MEYSAKDWFYRALKNLSLLIRVSENFFEVLWNSTSCSEPAILLTLVKNNRTVQCILSTYLTNYFNDFNIYETMVTLLVIIIREIPLLKSSYCAALLILPEVFQYKDTPNLSAQVF